MTDLPETTSIRLTLEGGWLTIALATPDNRNALTDAMAAELIAAFTAVREDRAVRGVTLRGEGGVFCAGGDLKAFKAGFHGGAVSHADVAAANAKGGKMFERVNTAPQVVIALVEGAAVAGGLGLACCADVVAVTRDARFSLTETQLGPAPAPLAAYIGPRRGHPAAPRLLLPGARFTGADAPALGLADYVAEDGSGLDAIEKAVRGDVARCAPGANALTKEIVLAAPGLAPAEMRSFAAERFARCMLSDEGREGIAAFAEKRKPRWAEEGA